MTNKIFYIDNLSFGTELEERVYDKISFDIIDRNKSQIHQISIVTPGKLDEMNVDFNNYGINAERNNGVIACLLARAIINGKLKSKSALTENEINKLKLIWTHLIECRLPETDCADDEMISKRSQQVQLIISAVVASGNSKLFRFISERLGINGLNCTYRYDTGIWPDSFFYPGRNDVNPEMIDILFRHWLSRVFIRVYSVTTGANDNINPQFASLIHGHLTAWARENSENAEIVLKALEKYSVDIHNYENNLKIRELLKHWFSLFFDDCEEETKQYSRTLLSNRMIMILFSQGVSFSVSGDVSRYSSSSSTHLPDRIMITLVAGESNGDVHIVGQSNSEEFVNKQKLAQILCDDSEFTEKVFNQYMNDEYCLKAAGIGADLESVKRAYKEQKDISSKGTGLSI